ncbi:DrmE family protein [Paenibacillus sp. Y412MC10]|uniref:DrmE family protein n=1 Tax=Geobacillus sp. (strain Y412MC10) TaxID=481743 RepID=UPI0011AB3385|nr:DrmE family protein [Paenibacillus sp. Y412MC10]
MENQIFDKLNFASSKAVLLLEGKLLIKNNFISQHSETIIELLTKSRKERGLIFHHGTSLPMYFAIVLACFKSFLSDDRDHAEFLEELNVGDLVLYENKRGVYDGRDADDKIIIYYNDKGGTRTKNLVPVSLANRIQPYYGNAKSLDGRGIKRKKNVKTVLSKLFKIRTDDIKSVIRNSVVVVCDKQEADRFINHITLLVDQLQVKIGDVFPAAYYTSNDIDYYSGNSAKIDPLIKFTNKLSVARELIIEDRCIETLLINGTQYFAEDISEIASIYNRSSLKSIVMLGEISKGLNSKTITNLENLKLFIWKQDEIVINNVDVLNSENVHDESRRLEKLSENFLNVEVKKVGVNFDLTDELVKCKHELYLLSRHPQENEKKTLFIKKSFWLLNLLEKSFFPIVQLEKMVAEKKVNAPSPDKELQSLVDLKGDFLGLSFEPLVQDVLDKLELIKRKLNETNPKFDYLIDKFRENKLVKRKYSIICAKTYYGKVFLESVPPHLREIVGKCDFFTPNKYSSNMMYHCVDVIGVWDWSKLNPLLISNTKSISFLLYRHENKRFTQAQDQTKKDLQFIKENNMLEKGFEIDNRQQHDAISVNTGLNEEYIENYLESITNNLNFSMILDSLRESNSAGTQTSEIVKVATLDTGEQLFLTQFYSPYVFDIDRQSVFEKQVSSLTVGDLLIFTNYDNEANDIVERIMDIILESDDCDENFRESYRKSLHWKDVLRNYMKKKRISYRDLSYIMTDVGTLKHEVTLKTWLDRSSHIVGPRDINSYIAIAKITRDPEILNSPEAFYYSTREVRTMRIRILKYLGKYIVQTYNKNKGAQEDEILNRLPIDLAKMSRLVEIEQLTEIESLAIPAHLANKPIIL